jgi:phosphorylcholine metabolism protein LicD
MSLKTVIFGAGHYGRAVLRKCRKNNKFNCICFLDSNIKKNETVILKRKVYYISQINKIDFDKIILCGRYIKEQKKQLKKYGINRKKILVWGKSKVAPSKVELLRREVILLKMLSYVIKKFQKNKILYWIDFSGLLALVRKQHLAELSDIDISINLEDVEKIYKVIKNNDGMFSFNREFLSKIKQKKEASKEAMYIKAKMSSQIIEPPLIDFVIKKITLKNVKNVRSNTIYPKKYWKSFDNIRYKGINLKVPNYPKKYLKYVYGKSWNKKAEFWSGKFKQ